MKVFIEKINGEFSTVNHYSAWYGFDCLGCDIEFFNPLLIEDYNISKDTVVVGSINTMIKTFRLLKVPIPDILDYPNCLKSFLKREIREATFGSIRKHNERIFAKPKDVHKLFTGQVFEAFYNTENLSDDLKVWISTPINFDVEYRCFVHNHELIYSSCYKGDFKKTINYHEVQRAIDIYSENNAPVAYCMDFGLYNGQTTLVEVNDCYSLGCYGLNPIKYAKMIADRWKEICS